MAEDRDKRKMADNREEMITLQTETGGEEFTISRSHLVEHSGYFAGLFSSGMRDSSDSSFLLPSLSAPGVEAVSVYLAQVSAQVSAGNRRAQRHFSLTAENLESVAATATYLQVSGMEAWISDRIKPIISPENCLIIHDVGVKFAVASLEREAWRFMCENFARFAESGCFLSLERDRLCALLDCDDVVVDSEVVCFQAALRWFTCNTRPASRGETPISGVLSHLRFYLMTEEREYRECEQSVRELPLTDEASRKWLLGYLEDQRLLHTRPLGGHTGERKLRSAVQVCLATGGFTASEKSTKTLQIIPIHDLTAALGLTHGDVTGQSSSGAEWAWLASDKTHQDGPVSSIARNRTSVSRTSVSDTSSSATSPASVSSTSSTCESSTSEVKFVRSKLELPQPLCEHCVAVLGGCLYVVGGQDKYSRVGKHTKNTVYRYNPFQSGGNPWSQMASMMSPRSLFYLAVLEETLVAVSGWIKPHMVTKTVERYFPADDRWETLNSLPLGLHEHAGCVHEGDIYVSGGFRGPNRGHLDVVYRHTLEGDTWETLAPLLNPRSYHVMVSLTSRGILVLGGTNYIGDDRFEDVLTCELYNVTSNQWTNVTSCPRPASCMTSLKIRNKVLIFGGHSFADDNNHRILQVLDVEKWSWENSFEISSTGIQYYACEVMDLPSKHLQKPAKIRKRKCVKD